MKIIKMAGGDSQFADKINFSPCLEDIKASRLIRFPGLINTVNATTTLKDGMFNERNPVRYLDVGLGALNLVHEAISNHSQNLEGVHKILDYGCGYGRVARWLVAAFPRAKLICYDTDVSALATIKHILGVETQKADPSCNTQISGSFDLIWLGSLMTHLENSKISKLLSVLRAALNPNGLIVATFHGQCVANRLRKGTKSYRLTNSQIETLLARFDQNGDGFSPYPNMVDYGISVHTPENVIEMLKENNYELNTFHKNGWDNHQDCYSFCHSTKHV